MVQRPEDPNAAGILGGPGKGGGGNAPALLRKFSEMIKGRDKEWERELKAIERARRYADGEVGTEGDEEQQVRANMILATQQALLPHVYAKNPEYAVKPKQSVSPMMYPVMRKFAETLKIAIEEEFKGARLKTNMKSLVRAAYTSRIGALKVTWQEVYGQDPIVLERLEDAQDQLAHVQRLTAEITEGDTSGAEDEALRDELQQTVEALQANIEVLQARGVTVSVVSIDNLRIPALRSLGDYRRAPWIAEQIYLNVEEARDLLGLNDEQLGNYTVYYHGEDGYQQASDQSRGDDSDTERYLCLWEFWHKRSMTIYTFAEGGDRWLKEPFQLQCAGDQWYPYFLLAFHWVDGKRWPKSDVELLMELQDEYNRTRTNMAEHRAISVPHWITDMSQDEKSIRRFEHADFGEVIVVDAGGKPLDQVFVPAPVPQFDPRMYDTQPIRSDMEWISGLGDAQRGSVEKAKTLGEAAILQGAFADRTSERRDEIETVLQDIAEYIAPMLLHYRNLQEMQTIAGPEAVWPTLAKEQLHDLNIEIRAGSTGQPDQDKEREQWMALYPQLKELVQLVMMFRAQGIPDGQNPYVLLMEETLKRFDERLDIEQFIPGRYEQQGAGQPNMGMGAPGMGMAGAQPILGPDGRPIMPEQVATPGAQPGRPGGGNGAAPPAPEAGRPNRPIMQP